MKTMNRSSSPAELSYLLVLMGRLAVAVIGGTAMGLLSGLLFDVVAPMQNVQVQITSLLLSLTLFAGAFVWSFFARRWQSPALGMFIWSLILAGILLMVNLAG